MIAVLAMVMVSLAQSAIVPDWPSMPNTAAGECSETVPIRIGQKIPNILVGNSGLASCSAICEPISSYAHLLQIEQHAILIEDLYRVDVEQLTNERDYWRDVAHQNNRFYRRDRFWRTI